MEAKHTPMQSQHARDAVTWTPETGYVFKGQPAQQQEPSPTAGMNIAQRILHVGGRNNATGYIEFGSIQAVEALVCQVLRDLPAQQQEPDLSGFRPETQEEFRGWIKDGFFVERAIGVMIDQEKELEAIKAQHERKLLARFQAEADAMAAAASAKFAAASAEKAQLNAPSVPDLKVGD